MTSKVLLSKIYNSHQLKQMDQILLTMLEGLEVQAFINGTLSNKWIQIELTGEDEEVATNLLEREIGFCPRNMENVKKFASLKGYISFLEKSKEELLVDIGIVEPKIAYATVPLNHLQANLSAGREIPLKKISELWGLCENLPIDIKVLMIKPEENKIEAQLQSTQIRRLSMWKDSLLDRLLVIGASKKELDSIIEQEGLERDIIESEELGLFEHALICKLGTDAAGLIGRIGRRLRKAKFTVFNPKRTIAYLEKQTQN